MGTGDKMSEDMRLSAPRAESMRDLGRAIASIMIPGDVIVLSGPLGAGKTTLSQGIGRGLGVDKEVVSPTFTIARELKGRYANGRPARLIHVDAYRLPGSDDDRDSSDTDPRGMRNRLLDQLEALGLDEELEDPGPGTCILIEWGSAMAAALADDRLEITISRPRTSAQGTDGSLTEDGERIVRLHPVGASWNNRLRGWRDRIKSGQ